MNLGFVSRSSNMEDLEYMKKSLNPKGKAELKMLADFIPGQHGKEVPDAYYARGNIGLLYRFADQKACFEEIYQMAADSASELVSYLQNKQYTCLLKFTLSIWENTRKVLFPLPPTAHINRIRTLQNRFCLQIIPSFHRRGIQVRRV